MMSSHYTSLPLHSRHQLLTLQLTNHKMVVKSTSLSSYSLLLMYYICITNQLLVHQEVVLTRGLGPWPVCAYTLYTPRGGWKEVIKRSRAGRFDHILYIPKLSVCILRVRVYIQLWPYVLLPLMLAGKRYNGEIFTDCERARSVGETCGLA